MQRAAWDFADVEAVCARLEPLTPQGKLQADRRELLHDANALSRQYDRIELMLDLMRRDRPQMAEDWLPDGKALVMSQVEPETGRDLHLVNVDTRETHPLANERGDEGGAAVSPDGRWVAYVWGTLDVPALYAVATSEAE